MEKERTTGDLAWDLFENTGSVNYFLFYRALMGEEDSFDRYW